jgi:hypothetical protein
MLPLKLIVPLFTPEEDSKRTSYTTPLAFPAPPVTSIFYNASYIAALVTGLSLSSVISSSISIFTFCNAV